jgi:hypothetical protein
MEYLLLIYETAKDFDARTNEQRETLVGAWRTYYQAMVDAGVYVSGSPLQRSATGSTVRLQNGKRHVQDGPYADTKEQLGGFIMVEVPSLEAALDWAARCPTAATGAVEVRPVAAEVRTAIVT